MMALATGAIEARSDGHQIVVTFQSGRDTIEIAMTFHQASRLVTAVGSTFRNPACAPSADVLPFPKATTKRRTRSREQS